jgi:hypothetical protein
MMDKVLDRLRQLHPPTTAAAPSADDWGTVERELGFALPDDYKALLGLYVGGPPFGEWFGFYNFLNARDRAAAEKDLARLRRVREQVHEELRHVAGLRGRPSSSVRASVPFPVYPEPGGLYPWGWAQDDWTFYWLCDAAANARDVVVGYKWVEAFRRFPGKTASQLLLDIAELLPSATLESILETGERAE